MDFAFNPEQELLRTTLAAFAARELAPHYAARDQDSDLPRDLVRQLGAMGLLAPMVPLEYGGQALDYVSTGIAFEEISRADINAGYVLLLSALVGAIVMARGDDRQKRAMLPAICSGEVVTALAVTEPSGGSDAAHVKLAARREGDAYIFEGEKSGISLASWADTAIIMARTGTYDQGAHGVSAFYVDLHSAGISRSRFKDLGTRAIGRGQIFFDSVRVPAEARIGAESAGFVQVMQGFDFSRSLIGLMCLAAAHQSVDETCKYVADRQAFGGSLAPF
jgi:cyclohexanecarboxyl-CoA dehydrogenase